MMATCLCSSFNDGSYKGEFPQRLLPTLDPDCLSHFDVTQVQLVKIQHSYSVLLRVNDYAE